jgi:hypothetical protein
MKKTLIALAAIATLSTGFVMPANAAPQTGLSITFYDGAQPAGWRHRDWDDRRYVRRHHRRLGPRRIAHILRRDGFVRIRSIRYHHGRYHVRAMRRFGPMFRLVVNAHNGNIMRMRPIGWNVYRY